MLSLLVMAVCGASTGGCGANGGDDHGTSQEGVALEKRKPTLARPEIGKIQENGLDCTGTLISPNVVLTAAPCIPSYPCWDGKNVFGMESSGDPTNPNWNWVYFYKQPNGSGDRCWNARPNLSGDEIAGDIGLMQLQNPVQGISPAPLTAPWATVHGLR